MRIVAAREGRVEGLIGIEAEAGDALVAGFELHQHLGQLRVAGGTGDQAHMRRALEDFLALLLGHAADDGEDLALARFALEMLQAVEDLLLGFVADAAGVVENVMRRFDGFDLRVALVEQRADDFFGVMGIHLAAESFDDRRFFPRVSLL